MVKEPVLSVGGENLIDHVTREGEVSANAGGSPYNVAMALGRQGATIHYLSPISTDAWGDKLADTLAAAGTTIVGGRVDLPTTMARVTVEAGIPTYDFERSGTAERAVTKDDLRAKLADVDALHTGSLAVIAEPDGQIWEDAAAEVYASGRFVSLDPNVRLSMVPDLASYRDRMFRMFKAVHLLKLSDEDLEGIFPDLDEAEALARVIELTSATLVVLTRGPEGASAWLGKERVDVAAPPVPNLVDTVGAGDTFMATLVATLASSDRLSHSALATMGAEDVRSLLQRAAMAAAINCGREGCDPPTVSELDAALGT